MSKFKWQRNAIGLESSHVDTADDGRLQFFCFTFSVLHISINVTQTLNINIILNKIQQGL